MSIVSLLNCANISNHGMQSIGGLLDDLLSYHTCKLLYKFPSSKVYASFGMLWQIWMNLHKAILALTKVNFNSLPTSILPQVTYSSVMFLGNTKKWACLVIYLGCLTWVQEEASCLWLSCCLPQALGSWEPVTLMCPICWKQGLSVTAVEQNGSSQKQMGMILMNSL